MAIVYIFICLSSKVALFQIASISPVIECCVNLEIFKYMNLSLDSNIPWQPQFSSTVIKDSNVTMIGAIGKAVGCGVSWIKEDVTRDNSDASLSSGDSRARQNPPNWSGHLLVWSSIANSTWRSIRLSYLFPWILWSKTTALPTFARHLHNLSSFQTTLKLHEISWNVNCGVSEFHLARSPYGIASSFYEQIPIHQDSQQLIQFTAIRNG